MHVSVARKILKQTKEVFDKIAEEFSKTRLGPWEDIKDFGRFVKESDSVLDLGCGNGRLYELFKDRDVEYIGIDQNKRFIELAKARLRQELSISSEQGRDGARAKFMLADALEIPFDKERFNVVLAVAFLPHIPSRELQLKALEDIHRILKPSGFLIMTCWNLWQVTLKKKSVLSQGLEKIRTKEAEWKKRYGFSKKDLGWNEVLTIWKGQVSSGPLYHHAFRAREAAGLIKEAGFILLNNYYSRNGKKAHWWNGHNIITIARK